MAQADSRKRMVINSQRSQYELGGCQGATISETCAIRAAVDKASLQHNEPLCCQESGCLGGKMLQLCTTLVASYCTSSS